MHGRAFVAFALSERSVDHCIRAGFLSQLLDRGRRNGAAAFNSVEAGIYDDHETELGPRPWRTLGGPPIDTNTRDMRWPTSDVPKPFVR
jgi:hypothetical protein